jgi:DNA repair protein RadC
MIQNIGDVEAPSQNAQRIAVHDHIVVGKNGHAIMKELKLI